MDRINRQKAKEIIASANRSLKLPSGYIYHLAGYDDLEAVLELAASCFPYNTPTRREVSYALTKGHGMVVLLYDVQGKIAGCDFYEFHARHRTMYVNITCLHQEFRGKGLSQIFFNLWVHVAKESGCKSVFCHVTQKNAVMIHKLETNGFKKTKTIPEYYSDGETAFTYMLALDNNA